MTPVHWCAVRGYREILKLLISKGALLDERDAKRMTPKDLATHYNHYHAADVNKYIYFKVYYIHFIKIIYYNEM